MDKVKDRIIFHIDVNSAYLSWTAVKRLQYGEVLDIREIPSAIGGDVESRKGIILAKSMAAKSFGVITGEPVHKALEKCPQLKIFPPDHDLYMCCSNAMVEILKEYSSIIERYSVDECFLDGSHLGSGYFNVAEDIKNRVKEELGFTVNIGISSNKLLAKMASDFQKPDKIHNLFHKDIKSKLWPLPVEDLFMIGRATAPKLKKLNINTIGDLANYDLNILTTKLKSLGGVLHRYANGIDDSEVENPKKNDVKGIGNSTTTPHDVENREEALNILLSLTEVTAMRLRKSNNLCGLVTVHIKSNSFLTYSHQKALNNYTDCTKDIYEMVKELFNEMWRKEPIRHLGVRLSKFSTNETYQKSIFEEGDVEKQRQLDKTIDKIRETYGLNSIVRSTFINSNISPLTGRINEEEDYSMINTML